MRRFDGETKSLAAAPFSQMGWKRVKLCASLTVYSSRMRILDALYVKRLRLYVYQNNRMKESACSKIQKLNIISLSLSLSKNRMSGGERERETVCVVLLFTIDLCM